MPLFLAVACGDIHTTDSPTDPLVILGAQVEGVLPDNYSADLLLASLIWTTLPQELIECLDRAETEEEIFACTTPDDFRPVLASDSVAIQPTFPASFRIPLYTLPDLSVLSGKGSSRLGRGILVVYEDGNHNMRLDLVPPGATESEDTILASGRPTDEYRMDDVLFRQGELSPISKLFEPFGCPEAPKGFSVLTRDFHASSGWSCTVSSATDTTIPVHFEDSEELRQLICEPQTDFNTRPSDSEPPPPDREIKCHFHDTLEYVKDPTWYCKYKQIYQLAGCEAYYGCEDPDWDLNDNPPVWWPCTGESDNGFTISDHPADLTPVADELFYIRYDSGDELYPMNEIEVWLLWSAEEALILTQAFPRSILLIDNDGDSLFSQGDALEIFEPVLSDFFNAEHKGRRYKVILQHSLQPLEPIETLAKLTWKPPL